MTDDEFRNLIKVVQAELTASGASDVADERGYAEDLGDDGRRQLPPRDLLIAMLKAFDRHMALRDRATYRLAMTTVDRAVRGEGPQAVLGEAIPITDGLGTPTEASLANAPDLAEVRSDLRTLIGSLLEGPLELGR